MQRKSDSVIVQVDDEIHVAVRASRVRRVVTADQLQKYRDMVVKAGDDAELHYQLAIWCVTGDHVPGDSQRYKSYHMQRAISLDPEHSKARAALGYKKHEGKWIRTTDLMRDRGMISVAGGWEIPEAVAIEDFQDETNVDAKKWIREVARLTSVVMRRLAQLAGVVGSTQGDQGSACRIGNRDDNFESLARRGHRVASCDCCGSSCLVASTTSSRWKLWFAPESMNRTRRFARRHSTSCFSTVPVRQWRRIFRC